MRRVIASKDFFLNLGFTGFKSLCYSSLLPILNKHFYLVVSDLNLNVSKEVFYRFLLHEFYFGAKFCDLVYYLKHNSFTYFQSLVSFSHSRTNLVVKSGCAANFVMQTKVITNTEKGHITIHLRLTASNSML